ncbi:MAG: hypothetical protein ABI131_04320 [Nostocoides sp.]
MSPSSDTPAATETQTTAPVDALAAPLAACQAEVTAGDALATAAAASARDWGAHAGAEVSLDAGLISYAQAEAIWGASKKPGAADLAAFAAAEPVYTKAASACPQLATAAAAAGSSAPANVTACVARSQALAAVAKTGTVVNGQWAAHQAQMTTKATAAGPAYHQKWMNFVADSKSALAAYGTAAAALDKAPACS